MLESFNEPERQRFLTNYLPLMSVATLKWIGRRFGCRDAKPGIPDQCH